MASRPSARPTRKTIIWSVILLGIVVFLTWRMIRPMNIFVVSDSFALPMAVVDPPDGIDSLSAASCGECHVEIYREWASSMHAQAWIDPYYQVDLAFDGNQQICLNCHIPLQNQQQNLVTGFTDKDRFKPILQKNPDFDPELQQEGVTCVVCHLRDGVIIGPYTDVEAPHLTRFEPEMLDGLSVCQKCHVVSGKRWDTFFRMPPCGTVSEIKQGQNADIDCTGCHMPAINRPAATEGGKRSGSRHLWRGGHDKETVRQALDADFSVPDNGKEKRAILTLTNTGADHFLPTGTPDRHLTVLFILQDPAGSVLKEKAYTLKRTILWRPFIIDLWDTRLQRNRPREFSFTWNQEQIPAGSTLTVTVRYHLLDEARRRRIGYRNTTPLSYPVFEKQILLGR